MHSPFSREHLSLECLGSSFVWGDREKVLRAGANITHTSIYIYIYMLAMYVYIYIHIYIYMCECVCVCERLMPCSGH